jgi:hypothetical protein
MLEKIKGLGERARWRVGEDGTEKFAAVRNLVNKCSMDITWKNLQWALDADEKWKRFCTPES